MKRNHASIVEDIVTKRYSILYTLGVLKVPFRHANPRLLDSAEHHNLGACGPVRARWARNDRVRCNAGRANMTPSNNADADIAARGLGTVDDLVVGMAGAGGDGIVSAGESLISAAAAAGYHALMTKSFGPQIRGGESSCRVRLSTRPPYNQGGALDVAVALNWEDFLRFGNELTVDENTIVIYDSATEVAPDALPLGSIVPREVIAVPIGGLSSKATKTPKAKNSVVVGLLSGWFGIPAEPLLKGIRKRFGKKGAELVEANERAFALGVEYAQEHPLTKGRPLTQADAATPKLLTDGNDMCAAAALFAGCQFFGGYPITPSTEIMQFMSREIWKYGGVVLQAEDEIAGIGAALGASYAGKKSMTATSGPGMALKTEIMGLASIAELPLVIVNVQRGGPSTGMPTKTEQADLFQAAFSAHGDVLRPVLAPSSVADTFALTVEAFNIAEQYQTPVILLSDQELSQRKETVEPIDTSRFTIVDRVVPTEAELAAGYQRFKATESGVSPISHPGLKGGNYLGAGIEHNEAGAPTASGAMHAKMSEKRFRKLAPLLQRHDLFKVVGDPNASLAIIGWGSVAGVCEEAAVRAREAGQSVKLIVPYLLWPIPEPVWTELLASVRVGLVVEQSYQGQLYRLLRMQLDLPKGLVSFARVGANPFQPQELVSRLAELASTVKES